MNQLGTMQRLHLGKINSKKKKVLLKKNPFIH